jgi:triosephosphate isomerase
MRKLIVANWKENPATEKAAAKLFHEVAKMKRTHADVVVCPPFVYLEEVTTAYRAMRASARKNFAIGAQDAFWEETGAFTSEVGPGMIKSLGARYVIIGHSERRKYLEETDLMINKKISLALKDGLRVILCVGESVTIRKRGFAAAKKFVSEQLRKDLRHIKKPVIVAYEPVWAIGTGKNDTPEDAAAMAKFIKSRNAKRISCVLYGGSVNSRDAGDYVQYKEIGGALVGGASLRALEFKKIISTNYGKS